MKIPQQLQHRWPATRPKDWPLEVIPRASWAAQRPTYREAQPAIIDAALERARQKPTGNWYAFAGSADVRPGRPFGTRVAGSRSSPGATNTTDSAWGLAVAHTWGPIWPPGPCTAAR